MKRSRTLVPLKFCPPGLFLFEGELCFRSEYKTTNANGYVQSDAYIVATGEYFWGGASNTGAREQLKVEPVRLEASDAH